MMVCLRVRRASASCMGLCIVMMVVTAAAVVGQERPSMMISDCDDAAAWTGGEAARKPRTQGEGSIRWQMAANKALRLAQAPPDWSEYNALAFDLYAEKATGSPLWVLMSSDNPQTEGPDYFTLRLKLDHEGWRHYVLPFDEIGSARRPIGWHQIELFRFHSAWDPEIEVDPEAVVYVDDIRLERHDQTGPRMTDEELFEALDLQRPELAAVREAVEAGDVEAAKAAWAGHLRARESPRWFQDWRERPEPVPPEQANTGVADLALENTFRWQGEEFFLGEDIDWSQNQMTEGESATVEWNARLNRHPMFTALATAYWRTREERYAEKLVELWVDWIEDAPLLLHASGNSPYHWAWETLNTAVRASNTWPDTIFRTLDAPGWTDEALVMVTKSFAEHARHLRKHPTSGNWLTAESTGLYYTGVLFPEFEEAPQWRETALQRLYDQMEEEVYPDGLEFELALGYGLWVLRNYSDVLDFAILNDRRDEVPADWLQRIEAMYDYVLYASMPDGTVPGLNDSGNTDRGRYMQRAAEYFPEREDFAWAAGARGHAPADTSRAFDYSGHYVMRSGWSADDLFMLLDAGLFGSGHQHEDKLTFVLYAMGRMHVVDAGNYMYDRSRWRRYVLSTRGHNTVRVDGLDQHRRGVRDTWVLEPPFQPLGNPWVSGDAFDLVQGTYNSGYGDENQVRVTHTRSVLFVKPSYWIIVDHLSPQDEAEHEYESLFHLNANDAEVGKELSVTSVTGEGQSRLQILPLPREGLSVEVVTGIEEELVQGWAWTVPGDDHAIPTAVYRLSGAGRQALASVLWPVAEGEQSPVASIERIETGVSAAVAGQMALVDGSRHLFAFQPGPGEMEFGGFRTDAEVAFVEVLPGGEIGRSFLYGGNRLEPVQ
ncbi:MAG: alginate lyase family protein [Armatimonadota bacterium]|nr:alginate lyase family protein [Armatimonadota bacterium]